VAEDDDDGSSRRWIHRRQVSVKGERGDPDLSRNHVGHRRGTVPVHDIDGFTPEPTRNFAGDVDTIGLLRIRNMVRFEEHDARDLLDVADDNSQWFGN
jgi:hypothetical protein